MTAFECMLVDEYDRARRLIPGLEEEIAGLPRVTVLEGRGGAPGRVLAVRRSCGRVSVVHIAEVDRDIELRRALEDALVAFRKTMVQVERALGCDPDAYAARSSVR